MIFFVLAFTFGACDTVPLLPPRPQVVATEVTADTLPMSATPSATGPAAVADTMPRRRRAKAIEYSDWYATRLQIHKAASWATVPLFLGQYFTGQTLIAQGTSSPSWVKVAHPVLATGVLALFATNTVTGVWNLWEGRADPTGRAWRMTHSILMLASDAGFAYVGQLSHSVKQSGAARNQHRAAAIASSGLALVSYVMMLPPFRKD
jgi:hypothetical protein